MWLNSFLIYVFYLFMWVCPNIFYLYLWLSETCAENTHVQGAVKIVKMTATPTTVKSCPVQGSKKWIVRDIGWYKTVTEATDTVIGCFQGVNKNHRKDVLTAATKRHYDRETFTATNFSAFFFAISLLILLPLWFNSASFILCSF